MNRSIVYLKKLDHLLGPHLLRVSVFLTRKKPGRSLRKTPEEAIRNVLVIRPGGIGDAALLMPSIKILKKLFPDSKVDMLCEKRNRGIFQNSPFFSRILDYRKISHLAGLFKNRYDLIVDTEQSHFLTSFLVSAIRSNLKIGFDTEDRGPTYDIAVSYSHEDYEVISFFNLFKSAIEDWPVNFEWDFPYVFPTTQERIEVQRFVKGRGNLICLFPGASISERRWPAFNWAKVADSLHDRGFQPVLIGAGGETQICKKITGKAKKSILNLCDCFSLTETAALLEESSLLITTDSGILHLGVICNTPTVSLFGPGIAAKWAPRGKRHITINKNFQCSPCTRFGETPPCPIHAQCIKAIKIGDVLEAAYALLN